MSLYALPKLFLTAMCFHRNQAHLLRALLLLFFLSVTACVCLSSVCVHSPCSDGLGRSCLFVTLWVLTDQLMTEDQVDVVSTFKAVRASRPGAMDSLVRGGWSSLVRQQLGGWGLLVWCGLGGWGLLVWCGLGGWGFRVRPAAGWVGH